MTRRVVFLCLLLVSVCAAGWAASAQTQTPSTVPQVVQSEGTQPETSPSEDLMGPDTEGSVVEPVQPEQPAADQSGAAEAESNFDVQLDGHKTWTVRYGFGSPLGLATAAIAPGQLTLDQSLTVDIVGTALSVLTIEAHYNDQLPDSMQSLALYLDTEHLQGVLGDFTFASIPDFTTYNKKMKGLQLEADIGDAVLTAVASKAEGISETTVFVGQTAHADLDYSMQTDGEPTPYRRNLDGLYAYPLQTLYAEEFSTLSFHFADLTGLRTVFKLYEVGYLVDELAANPDLPMKTQDFIVLDGDEQYLLLRRDPINILRDRLTDLIDDYNDRAGLSGDDAKDYPFIAGTDYELQFLAAVAPYARIIVDGITYPLGSAERRRFYSLGGHTNVQANTASIEVSTDGKTFESISSYRLPNFTATIHEEAGILECDFPSSFYTTSSILRVGFNYTASEGAFMLGLSLIPNSERVTLNGEVLTRDVDYSINYETGTLFILRDISDTDVIQVDYERYAGGFGSSSDYARYFYGLTLDWPISDVVTIQGSLLQLAEAPGSVSNPDAVATMPNRHTIAGVQANLTLVDFQAGLLLGYNQDRYPFDDNKRAHDVNEIAAIAAGDGYVLFGHRGGLTVDAEGDWQTYGVSSGLSSPSVQAIVFGDGIVYLGTDTGLTIVRLDGASPFDRAANWERYFTGDELASSSITALLVDGETVWVGTGSGLVRFPADSTDPEADWEVPIGNGFSELSEVRALVRDGDLLYIGTAGGLYAYDVAAEDLELVSGTEGESVNDLALWDGTLYVASDLGLRGFRNGIGTGWLLLGQSVHAVASANGALYYGTDAGLAVAGSDAEPTLTDWDVTALSKSAAGLWVGVRASEDYNLTVWLVSAREEAFHESVTGISGDDPHTFLDTVASEHTVTGWISRASFRQKTDDYTLSGVVEIYPPTFRAIGSTHRSDAAGWTISGNFPLGDWGSLALDHDYHLIGQSSDLPEDRMNNSVTLDWSFGNGPDWEASIDSKITHEDTEGGTTSSRETSSSLSIDDTFFRDSLALSISWTRDNIDTEPWSQQWTRESLSLTLDWQLTSSLSTNGSWTRPIRRFEDELFGTQRLNWSWDWTPALTFGDTNLGDVDASYSLSGTQTLFEDTWDWTHEAEVRFNLSSFQLAQWDVTPDVKFSGEHDARSTDLHGQLVVRSTLDDLTIRSTLRGDLTDLGRPIFNRGGDLSVSVKYSGFAGLDPTLTYKGSRSQAVKGDETALTASDSLISRLVWSPDNGPSDEFSLSVLSKRTDETAQLTATLDNRFTMDVAPVVTKWFKLDPDVENAPVIDLTVGTKAEYRNTIDGQEISFSTRGEIFGALSEMWSVVFATTCTAGSKPNIGLYSSLLFELTFAIDF